MAGLNLDKFKRGDRVVFIEDAADPFYPRRGATGTILRTDGDGCPCVEWDKPTPCGRSVTHVCDFCMEKFVEPQKVVIWRDPHDMLRVVAKDLTTKETAEARCHPSEQDEFNFFVGAAIALGRLYGHEPEITEVKPEAPATLPDLPVDHACKFKVGDKVIGNKRANRYGITNEGWIGTVAEIIDPYLGYGCDEKCWINFVVTRPEWGSSSLHVADDAFDLYEEPMWNGKVVCVKCGDPDFSDWWTVGKIYEVQDGVIRDNRGVPRDPVTCAEELSDVTHPIIKFVEIKE